MDCITVYFYGQSLLLQKDYADLKGLKQGYMIKSESEFWGILRGHAEHQISKLEMLIEAKKSVN
jgi:hypothetical protein